MYCGNCGAANQDGNFCSSCGKPCDEALQPENVEISHVPRSEAALPALRTNNGSVDRTRSVPGFVLSLIGVVFVAGPIICLPFAITGIVLSKKRLNELKNKEPGSALAKAGFVIGIVAVSITTLFMILAVPGAIQHNFG